MIDRKAHANPFRGDVATDCAKLATTDVAEIHRVPFDLCRAGYDSVAHDQMSWSVLLHGDAGCGKTHLLCRLERWLAGAMDSRPLIAPALFVRIRMETAPSQVWRHVRRRFAEALTAKKSDETCPLDEVLRRFAGASSNNLEQAFENSRIADLGLDLTRVLEQFGAGPNRKLARAWLAGDSLSESDLQILNLPLSVPDEIEDESAEGSSRRVVLATIRLMSPLPVVFCFDQVEALGIALGASRPFGPFAAMGATLVDETQNVFLVCTVNTSFRELEGSMRSDYQRISKSVSFLEPLDFEQGRQLVDARLKSYPELQGTNPIPDAALSTFFEQHHGGCDARRVIHEARRLFTEWQQHTPERPVSVDAALEKQFTARLSRSVVRKDARETDIILGHGLAPALQILGSTAAPTGTGVRAGTGDAAVEVIFASEANMNSLAAKLRRLLESGTPLASLRLVRDERAPVSPGAVKVRERLREIEAGGGRVVQVRTEALAALDAVRLLLSSARGGELSANGEGVEENTVREWLARNMPRDVSDFMADLVGEAIAKPASPNGVPEAARLLELIRRHKVIAVDEAVQSIAWPAEKIEKYARTHPLHIRWFGGPCPVVCLATAAAAGKGSHREQ